MAIFAVIPQPGPNAENLAAAISKEFPNAFMQLTPSTTWLVHGQGVAKDVADKLGITEGENGSAVVLETASYFGRANPAIWSWIKTRLESSVSG